MHAIREFILRNARFGLAIAMPREAHASERCDCVDRRAARLAQHAFGIFHVKNGIARRTTLHTLIDARKEATSPDALSRIRRLIAGNEHDKRGQIARFAAEAVSNPRAETRGTEP